MGCRPTSSSAQTRRRTSPWDNNPKRRSIKSDLGFPAVPADAPEGLGTTGVLPLDAGLIGRWASAVTAPQPPVVACRSHEFFTGKSVFERWRAWLYAPAAPARAAGLWLWRRARRRCADGIRYRVRHLKRRSNSRRCW